MYRPILTGALCLCAALLAAAELTWQRNWNDFRQLPEVHVLNPGDSPVSGEVELRLTGADGEVVYSETVGYEAAPGGDVLIDAWNHLAPLEQTVLAEAVAADLKPGRLSGIFGVARPFARGGDRLVGMNVHLGRYQPEERWQVLQLMRDAGVTTVRVDCDFGDYRDPDAVRRSLDLLEEEIVALEAFGMEPLVLLAYFPGRFYDSPEKAKMAYEWSRIFAERFKGRASWHYGNETNSGWAGYGAATDMGELHKAFALGTAAADPGAQRGSFGIAEGLPGYSETFLATGAGEYLEALCVHPYSGTPEAGIAKMLGNKALLKPGQELWATEIGYHVDDTEVGVNPLTRELTRVMGFSTEQQADFISRLYILGKAFGVDRIYWYDFFGKNDPETFWLVDGDFSPKPAYHTLAAQARWLDGATSLGGTDLDEKIQRHYFRRPDGRIFATLWTQQEPEEFRAGWLAGAEVFDAFGQAVDDADGSVRLSAQPRFVLFPEGFSFEGFTAQEVLASAMDQRTFHLPAHRFTVEAGGEVTVPITLFNASKQTVTAAPAVRRRLAGWEVALPAALEVKPGETAQAAFSVKAPADALPGVEYHFDFAADLQDGSRTLSYPVRIQVPGEFPYQAILDYRQVRDYPMWNPMFETELMTGREELSAAAGAAAVDGKLGEWRPEEFYELDQHLSWLLRDPKLPGTEEFTVKVALRWDEERLYAAFLVLDDDLSWLDAVSRDWRDNDNLRLYLSTESDPGKRGDQISEKELLLILAASDVERTGKPVAFSAVLGGHARTGVEAQLELAAQLWTGGYALEVSLPWSVLDFKPESGAKLGLNVLADDADGGYRRTTAMTRLISPDYWMSPKSLGTLRLE